MVSLLLTPIELIKCRIQVQDTPSKKSPLNQSSLNTNTTLKRVGPIELIKTIYTQNGVKGFYSGHLGTFVRESFGCGVWFGVYEEACLRMSVIRGVQGKEQLAPLDFAICGGLAGIIKLKFLILKVLDLILLYTQRMS